MSLPLGCTHDVDALLSEAALSRVAKKHAEEGRVALRTQVFLGQRNVSFGFSRQPLEKCVHVVLSVGAPADAEPGTWDALATELFAWEFSDLAWQERYKPCPDCRTDGCPTCERKGWERAWWCDAVIGNPGASLREVVDPRWEAWNKAMPARWTWLSDALSDPRRR